MANMAQLLSHPHDSSLDVPLLNAAIRGRTSECARLLDAGANIETRSPANGGTPIMAAAQQGHLATVRLLHQRGANVLAAKIDGFMAIHMAAQFNRPETVQYLVEEAGVGVDTVSRGTALQHVTIVTIHIHTHYSPMVEG